MFLVYLYQYQVTKIKKKTLSVRASYYRGEWSGGCGEGRRRCAQWGRYANHLLYWYKCTNTDAEAQWGRYANHLLYWYKCTNTDAEGGADAGRGGGGAVAGDMSLSHAC